ncbi:MAG: hypothetical protein IJC48_01320 [Clostridia bacterium]|nr:hypothetical protein [Clostridia bacterium]
MIDHFAPSVHFSKDDYFRLQNTYRSWWKGELSRPIVPFVTTGHEPGRKPSAYTPLCFENAWDFSVTPDQLVDACDWQLSQTRFHGDAFPMFSVTPFGAGTLAAFLGCTPVGRKETVWFFPPEKDIPIENLHFEIDKNNPCLRRVLNVYEAGMEKWRGSVVITMADLGGIMDVLASFRGSENLLMDLYDSPDEVKRCINEIQDMWFECFKMINGILGNEVMGHSHWYGIFDEKPNYILQSDFSYMIGPKMFDEFIAPELSISASRIQNAVYHMDGIGQIPHLESLLKIDGIRGIQWVPGDGEALKKDWTELLIRIIKSGKKLIAHAQKDDGRPVDFAPDPGQLLYNTKAFDRKDMKLAREYGEMYGIEV